MIGNYIVLGIFIFVLLAVALWGMAKTRNTSDFFLGGKTLGPWILAISYGTTYFSAVVFIGFAGQFGWTAGFGGLWVGLMNALVGGALAWIVLGRRTRRMSRNLQAMTMPEFFASRYDSRNMKWIAACVIFVFLIPYSASVFAGLGYLFREVFHLTMTQVLTLICIVTGLYVFLGGYKAAARIDFIQGMVMFIGTILMVFFVLRHFGGLNAAIDSTNEAFANQVAAAKSGAEGLAPYESVNPIPGFILWSVVFMTSVGAWGLPQMVHKYYAIKDESQIFRGAIITTIFAIVIGCSAYFCGAFSHILPAEELAKAVPKEELAKAALPEEEDLAKVVSQEELEKAISDNNKDNKNIVETNALVPIMLIASLPKSLMLVILLLVLSASMSTLSSLVLTSSSAVSIDLYKGFLAKEKSENHYLWVMRCLSAIFILISWLIAIFNPSWIVALMSLSWGAIAGTFLSPFLYGLYWKGITKAGAYAGMATGFLTMNGIYWYRYFVMGPPAAKGFAPVAATIAIIVPFLVVPPVSLLSKKLSREKIDQAFGDSPVEKA